MTSYYANQFWRAKQTLLAWFPGNPRWSLSMTEADLEYILVVCSSFPKCEWCNMKSQCAAYGR